MQNVIGLFGTCDNSKWREPFMQAYESHKIEFFNPDAGDNWHPGMIEDENRNLREDHIILFPVLGESLGVGSLGEIGFSVLNVLRNIQNGSNQYLIAMIDDVCTDERKTADERKTSDRTRKLVKSKLVDVRHPNVFVVDSLDDMLRLSIDLHHASSSLSSLKERYQVA